MVKDKDVFVAKVVAVCQAGVKLSVCPPLQLVTAWVVGYPSPSVNVKVEPMGINSSLVSSVK